MTPVEQLQAAKEYLIEHGWIKNDAIDRQGRACMSGAVAEVCHRGIGLDRSCLVCREYLERAINEKYGSCVIHHFNDRPSTTFDDVMSVFDEAILLAKEMEQ